MASRYARSEHLLKRAQRSIPLGSQTFSKSKVQYPFGVSPYFAHRAKGAHLWDVDGNEYIDFVNSLASITLGHCNPDIIKAVRTQLRDGTIFSLSHPLEIEVAEMIQKMVPCAEMVRYGKNGSDATAGAIRLARAYTRRDHVAVCGYHGWQDWYIGSTARNLGVPLSTQAMTHQFKFNALDSLQSIFRDHQDQVAAVILEPMNTTDPAKGFLEGVRDMAHRHGALLIFDETITGFRFANGGAQELFGVTPDLATFGKGVANGYPISVVAGAAKYMRLMEDIFFSFTFGGETLSLAAAKATLTLLARKPILKAISAQGTNVMKGVQSLIERHQLTDVLSISGHPSWSFLNFKSSGKYTLWQIKTLFLQEVFSRGLLTLGTHNMSYAHRDSEIRKLFNTYDHVFGLLNETLRSRDLVKRLRCETLTPLFRLR